MIFSQFSLFLALLIAISLAGSAQEIPYSIGPSGYRVVREMPMAGDNSNDFITYDDITGRLYVAHGSDVEVLDSKSGKLVGRIQNVPGVHFMGLIPGMERGFLTGLTTISAVNTKTLTVEKDFSVPHPHMVVYDRPTGYVFAISSQISVIDPKALEVVGKIAIDDSPEASFSDGHGKLYVSLAEQAALAVIDTTSLKVTGKIHVPNCQRPHGIAYDQQNDRIFVGCRDGGIITMNAQTGQAVAQAVACSGTDGLIYDPVGKMIFSACSEGVVSFIRQITPNRYKLIDTVNSALFAKTIAFDPASREIYLPAARYGAVETHLLADKFTGPVPYTALAKAPRSKLLHNSFRVIVLAPQCASFHSTSENASSTRCAAAK